MERRSMYNQLKAHAGHGTWLDFCRNELNTCSQAANRYIACYELVRTYPHILICQLTLKRIMYFKNEIIDKLLKECVLERRHVKFL